MNLSDLSSKIWDIQIYVLLGFVALSILYFLASYSWPYLKKVINFTRGGKSIAPVKIEETLSFEGLDELLAEDSEEQKTNKERQVAEAQKEIDKKQERENTEPLEAPPETSEKKEEAANETASEN